MKAIVFTAALLISSFAQANWSYDTTSDKMTGKMTTFATIQSTNSLNLDFPYKGSNFGTIMVRQHPSYGLDVMVSIDKGQVLCSSYSGCPIEVRFDDKPAVKFSGTESADRSSDRIFLTNAKSFINSAKTAKRILVRMNIYQAGAPVLEFSTAASLTWDQGKPSSLKKQ